MKRVFAKHLTAVLTCAPLMMAGSLPEDASVVPGWAEVDALLDSQMHEPHELTAADAVLLAQTVQGWLQVGVPEGIGVYARQEVSAVHITLHFNGQLFAAGEARLADMETVLRQPERDRTLTDVYALLAAAVTRADQAARAAWRMRSGETEIDPLAWMHMMRQMTLTLEIAGRPEEILLVDGAYDMLLAHWAPGDQAIVGSGAFGRPMTVQWPGAMRYNDRSAADVMGELNVAQGYPENDQAVWGQELRLWHMPVTCVATSQPGEEPQVLVRGMPMVPSGRARPARALAASDAARAFLMRQLQEDGRLLGGYQPFVRANQSRQAPLAETAWVLWALARDGRLRYLSVAEQAQVEHAILYAVAELGQAALGEAQQRRVLAWLLMALCELEAPGLEALQARQDIAVGLHELRQLQPTDDPAMRALEYCALAAFMRRTRQLFWLEEITGGLAVQAQELQADPPLDALLYAVMTEMALMPLMEDAPSSEVRLAQLYAAWQQVQVHQVLVAPAAGPADVLGGYYLSELPGPPHPDWRSVVPLLTGVYLCEIGVCGDDNGVAEGLREGVRFLMQQQWTSVSAAGMVSPDLAMGGVRSSPEDMDISLLATAMAMLTWREWSALEDGAPPP